MALPTTVDSVSSAIEIETEAKETGEDEEIASPTLGLDVNDNCEEPASSRPKSPIMTKDNYNISVSNSPGVSGVGTAEAAKETGVDPSASGAGGELGETGGKGGSGGGGGGGTKDDRKMRFDSVFPIIGDFGSYQKRIYLIVCLPTIACAMHKLAWVFLGAKLDHRCQLPIESSESAIYDQLPDGYPFNMTFPYKDDKVASCERYLVNFSDPDYFASGNVANSTTTCGGKYVYDYTKYKSSAQEEYDLVCDRTFLHTLAQTLFMVGILIGSILFGDLSDRYGRRPIFFLSLVIQVVFGILAGFAPDYWTFVVSRIIVGASTSGIFLVGFVLAMEMVGPSKRTFVGVVCQLFFTAGYLVTAVMSYLINDWKTLQVALSVPGVLFLSYYWFLPESVRWLLARGKRDEAKVILREVAKENKVELSEELLDSLSDDQTQAKESANVLDLLRYRKLKWRSFNIFFCWFVNSGVYYGLSLNTSNLGGNDYLNFAISGAVEVPAYLFLLISLGRFGRKIVLCGCMLAGGIFMAACALLPDSDEWSWVLISFAMIGKMCITASYGVIYIFSAESFPTVVRNSGIGASSMCARVGGIVANNLLLLGDLWKPLPLLLFGAASLISGLLSLLIPETFGKRLPDSMEDGERFGTKEYDNETNLDELDHHGCNGTTVEEKDKEKAPL